MQIFYIKIKCKNKKFLRMHLKLSARATSVPKINLELLTRHECCLCTQKKHDTHRENSFLELTVCRQPTHQELMLSQQRRHVHFEQQWRRQTALVWLCISALFWKSDQNNTREFLHPLLTTTQEGSCVCLCVGDDFCLW